MKVAALKCPICKAVIWSKARHDLQYCDCKKCFVDGGRSYTRVGHEPGIVPVMGVLNTTNNEFSTDDEEDLYQ